MKITFDPAKRRQTLAERGLDFEDADEVFQGERWILPMTVGTTANCACLRLAICADDGDRAARGTSCWMEGNAAKSAFGSDLIESSMS